jgi:3-hydroxyacyl-CoA dehydrogenase
LREIEIVAPERCLIASNTSAIPITKLQEGALRPERIVGMHWSEPAYVSPFMEIISGPLTAPA